MPMASAVSVYLHLLRAKDVIDREYARGAGRSGDWFSMTQRAETPAASA